MTDEGTRVANGQHTVPAGIAVETFADNFKGKLAKITPAAVSELLHSKDAMGAYRTLIGKAALETTDTFSVPNLVDIVKECQPKFQEKGVTVALCLLESDIGNFRWFWFEFIDHALFPSGTYNPEYDISNYQVVLDGVHGIPPGVAVEKLSDWSSSHLVKNCPLEVQAILESKLLTSEYDRMVKTLKESIKTRTSIGSWRTTVIAEILKEFQPVFESRGVEVVVCKAVQGWDEYKWLEFIDIEVAPQHYFPKYAVDKNYQSERLSKRNISMGSSFFGGEDVATEALVTDGVIKVASDCPDDVAVLLEEKGISDTEYDLLDSAISHSKSMRNFVEVWRLVEQKVVEFPPIQQLRDTFLAKGVKLILCESIGKFGKMYWLEYVDTEASPDYTTPYDSGLAGDFDAQGQVYGEATGAANGWLKVPEGVYVEGLNGVKKLTDECPPKVRDFLTRKGLSATYDQFIEAIVKSKKTRNWARSWRTAEIQNVLNDFQELFLSNGVKLVLCKIIPDGGLAYRWFEFIDLSVAERYVPQFDFDNEGPSDLETLQTTLKFPNGVAVEKLTDYKSLMEHILEPVTEMMEKKNCMDLYVALVEILCRGGDENEKKVGWSDHHMREVVNVLGPRFESKGVSMFLSAKVEKVTKDGKEVETPIQWIEFVDRDVQPNYVAQRGVDMKKVPTHGMNADEIIALSVFCTVQAVTIAGMILGETS
ncbi:unnamed protein product [Cylindrotheca closterium]|uniref:Uncharacterized protein n=1 Tax=Cylindrotheca closterium TaxID=2856 RepID=A0AAD2FEH5_9STRA|nr:unnamed protein product [Cylindrotheca closterium]